jgi:hypothetical protein
MRTNNMKQIILLGLATTVTLAVLAEYSVDWWTVDGGGGTSTGGVYTVSGTVGQPDAGVMSGGNYSLRGGFWSEVAAVQTPAAPYLWVARTQTNTVNVWWPVTDVTWQLQSASSLAATGSVWTVCAHATNGSNCVHTESPPTGSKFFRLHKP